MAREFGAINSGEQDPLNAQRNQLTRQGLKPTFSPWEGFISSFGGNWSVDYLIEAGVVGATNQFPMEKMSPDQVRDEYGIEVKEPVTWLSAHYQAKFERERAEKQFILQNVNKNARGSTALPLLGSLLDGVADPANLVTMAAVGVPFAHVGRALGIAGRGIVARGAALATELAAEGALEGLIQNAAMDTHGDVFGYERTPEERRGVMVDSMIYNVLLGGAIHGAQFAYGKFKSDFARAKTDTKYYENAKSPSDVYNQIDYRGKTRLDQPDYAGPKSGGDGVFYTVHNADSGNFSLKTQNNLGVALGGDGIILTSNNGRARNSAVQRPQAVNGQVLSVKIPELNLLNIDQGTNKEVKDAILQAIGKDKLPNDVVKEALNSGTTREVIETLSKVDELKGTNYVAKVNKALKEAGIDGYTLRNKDASGALGADESLYLFDPNKAVVENIEEFNVQQQIDDGDYDVSDIMEREVKYIESKDSHVYSDPEANRAFDEMDPMPLEDGYDLPDIPEIIGEDFDFIIGEFKDELVYHGTKENFPIEDIQPSQDGALGKGTYITTYFEYSQIYAGKTSEDGVILYYSLRDSKFLDIEKMFEKTTPKWESDTRKLLKEIGEDLSYYYHDSQLESPDFNITDVWGNSMFLNNDNVREFLIEKGYSGLRDGSVINIFDEKELTPVLVDGTWTAAGKELPPIMAEDILIESRYAKVRQEITEGLAPTFRDMETNPNEVAKATDFCVRNR